MPVSMATRDARSSPRRVYIPPACLFGNGGLSSESVEVGDGAEKKSSDFFPPGKEK